MGYRYSSLLHSHQPPFDKDNGSSQVENICLCVRDLVKNKDLCMDLLGLKIVSENDHRICLADRNGFSLTLEDAATRADQPNEFKLNPGECELVFTLDDVPSAWQKARGVEGCTLSDLYTTAEGQEFLLKLPSGQVLRFSPLTKTG